jgi:ribose transport system substrate-binding protein
MGIDKSIVLVFGIISFQAWCSGEQAEQVLIERAYAGVQQAIESASVWDGPTQGPPISRNRKIIFVASDLRNDGVNGVVRGVFEAVSNTDWRLQILDAAGSLVRQGAELRKAVGVQPDGIVLGGIDAQRHQTILQRAQKRGITVVGWHAAAWGIKVGPYGLYTNVTTDPLRVAELAAFYAIVAAKGQAKVVIFYDPSYGISRQKAQRMVKIIEQCQMCRVIAQQKLPFDQIERSMPEKLNVLIQKYPDEITHILTINDLYIDFAVPSFDTQLEQGKAKTVPGSISAGDGSRTAYDRIRHHKYQLATVPEPLLLHGWQIVDELNRAFHRLPPSGYSASIHLVTSDNIDTLAETLNQGIYDPQNGYRDAYLNIWKQ